MQVNVVGQIFLTNAFLGGAFLTYGMEVVQFLDQDPETRVDPMARVFPRLTKCVFHKYGASGELLSLFEGFSHTKTTILLELYQGCHSFSCLLIFFHRN